MDFVFNGFALGLGFDIFNGFRFGLGFDISNGLRFGPSMDCDSDWLFKWIQIKGASRLFNIRLFGRLLVFFTIRLLPFDSTII